MAEFWRHGGTPIPATDVTSIAKRFEDLGWDGLVVGEDNGILPDPYVYLTYAAAATTTLKLGTGVAVPIRHPFLAANAIASLHAISGGRTFFSFGRGDGAMAQLGQRPITVGAFETYLTQVQRYLRRQDVELGEFSSTLERLFTIDPSLDVQKPPIDVSATGPKMIALAARLADGVTFAVGADVPRLKDLIAQAREARAAAGLDPETLRIGCYVSAGVTLDGDRTVARDIIRGTVLRHARFSAFEGKLLDGVAREDQEAILKAFDVTRDHGQNRPRKADFSVASVLPDEFIDRFAIVGTPEECAGRFQEIIDLGVDRFLVLTRVPTTDPGETNSFNLAQHVLPLLAGSSAARG
jgi:5,10-methylenetetrahydromethanopterin reductase